MQFLVLNMLAGLLVAFNVILWTPFSNWFIEIFSPSTKLFALNVLLLTASLMLFMKTSSESRKMRVARWTLAVMLLISGIFSLLFLTFTTIPLPLYALGWNTDNHKIQVGSHYVEARKTAILDLSSGSSEIFVREVKPLSSQIRLVRQPIAVSESAINVDLRRIDNSSFSYQFVSDEVDYPVCIVHFKN